MGISPVNIFSGWSALSPRAASTQLANASVRGSVSSLAALRYALPQSHGLVPLVDRFVQAAEKGNWQLALSFKRIIEGKIRLMSPKILAQALFRVSGRRAVPSHSTTRFESAARATELVALMLTKEGETVAVRLAGSPRRRPAPKLPAAVTTERLAVDEKITHARHLRRSGQKANAATFFAGAAQDCLDVRDVRHASEYYQEAAVLYLEAEDYVQARVSAARAQYYFIKEGFNEPERAQVLHQLMSQVKEQALAAMKPASKFDFAKKLTGFFGGVAKLHEEAGEKMLAGNAHYSLAYILTDLDHYEEAIEAANQAAELFLEVGEYELVGNCTALWAESLLAMGARPESVMRVAQRAARFYHRAKQVDKEGRVYEKIGNRLCDLGQYVLAPNFFNRAIGAYERARDRERIKECRFKIALAQTRAMEKSGETDRIPRRWERRIAAAQRDGDVKGAAQAYLMLSQHWRRQNQSAGEITNLQMAAGLFTSARETSSAVASYGMLSLVQKQSGQIHPAQHSWQTALRLLGAAKDIGGEAAVRAVVGNALVDLERYEEAKEMLEKSLRGLEASGDDRLGLVYESLAGVYKQLGLSKGAESVLAKAHRVYSLAKDKEGLRRVEIARRRLFPSN